MNCAKRWCMHDLCDRTEFGKWSELLQHQQRCNQNFTPSPIFAASPPMTAELYVRLYMIWRGYDSWMRVFVLLFLLLSQSTSTLSKEWFTFCFGSKSFQLSMQSFVYWGQRWFWFLLAERIHAAKVYKVSATRVNDRTVLHVSLSYLYVGKYVYREVCFHAEDF